MNQAILIGGLTRDPEMRYLPSGKPVTTFSVATSDKRGGEEYTEYHNIVVWGSGDSEKGDAATACATWLKKGSKVAVRGKIKTRSYETQAGEKRKVTEIEADRFGGVEFLSGTRTREEVGGQSGAQQPAGVAATSEDDDIPF